MTIRKSIFLTGAVFSLASLFYWLFKPYGIYSTSTLLFQSLKLFFLCFVVLFANFNDSSLSRIKKTIHKIKLPFWAHFAFWILVFYLFVKLMTPLNGFGIGKFGAGYGDDGQIMGWLAENFSWFSVLTTPTFYGGLGAWELSRYRILPLMLVHAMGVNTFLGYSILNFVSYVLSCILIYKILKFYTLSRANCCIGVFFFSTLKLGLKFLIYMPILTDGLGTLLLLAIVYFTLTKKHIYYLVAMSLSVYCRENLLALMFFNILYNIRTKKAGKDIYRAVLRQIIPFSIFVLSRKVPVLLLSPLATVSSSHFLKGRMFLLFFDADWKVRVFLAHVNALGILVMLPFFYRMRTNAFLKDNYEWIYYLLINFFLCLIGGGDLDRYATWQMPLLIVLVMLAGEHYSAVAWLYLLLIQSIAMEFFLPWMRDREFYLSLMAAHPAPEINAFKLIFSVFLYLALEEFFDRFNKSANTRVSSSC